MQRCVDEKRELIVINKKLAKKVGVRETFTGIFRQFGTKKGWNGIYENRILLKNIKTLDGSEVVYKAWFNFTKEFEKAELKANDIVQFDARVKKTSKWSKDYRNEVYKLIKIDYKLVFPTKIKIISGRNSLK